MGTPGMIRVVLETNVLVSDAVVRHENPARFNPWTMVVRASPAALRP